MLGPLLEKKAIWRAEVPPDTIQGWKDKLELGRQKWGRFFSDPAQCDLFNMLPVSDKNRFDLMRNMIAASKLRDEVRLCTGKADQSKEHRDTCIECVVTHHPDIAKPYY